MELKNFYLKKGMLEGANMPFSIKLNVSYLYFIIPILCFVALLVINIFLEYSLKYVLTLNILISVALYLFYIYCILDINETMSLVIFKFIFSKLGITFVDNLEHILYRAKLSVYECKRQGINLDNPKKILVAIEDKNFYQHKGIDYRAIGRALLSHARKIPYIKKIPYIAKIPFSGGSTITQQLFRTLFVENMNKKRLRRKLAEICLSRYWLNKILPKKDQLEIYLNAVRFDKQIFGIMQAMQHFYGNTNYIKTPLKSTIIFSY